MSSHAEKEPFYKKVWFWFIIILVVLCIMAGMFGKDENNIKNNVDNSENTNYAKKEDNRIEVSIIDFSLMSKEAIKEWCDTNKIKCYFIENYSDTVEKGLFVSQSTEANNTIYQGDMITITYSLGKEPSIEYKNALKKAEIYSNNMNMSKESIYDQLISEYGEKFPTDAAQYAIDNIVADWNANALAKARIYQERMNMSKKSIYDQLISKHGEKFTKEEAQYAIDHLE